MSLARDMSAEVKNSSSDISKESANSPPDPRSSANILSRLLFSWVYPLVILSVRRSLKHSDLYAHPAESDSKRLLDRFNRHWEKEIKGKSPRLWRALVKTLLGKIVLHHVLYSLRIVGMLTGSILLGYISEYLINPNGTTERIGYIYACAITALAAISVVISNILLHTGWLLSMNTRVIITTAIYQKLLKLSHNSLEQMTVGNIVSLASNDVRLVDQAFCSISIVLLYPLFVLAATGVMYFVIGWYSVLVTAVFILLVPLQAILFKLYRTLRSKSLQLSDSRVRTMNEIISGMRVVKMYAWEYAFKKMVDHIRIKEIYIYAKIALIHSWNLSSYPTLKICSLFVLFSVAAASGTNFNSSQIFIVFTIVGFLRFETSLNYTYQLAKTCDLFVALNRIQDLLCASETSSTSETVDSLVNDSPTVSAENVSVSWKMDNSFLLSDISFALNKKHLMAVVGPVGAGKSTLLQCILRELPASNGSVTVRGSVAYASQEVWVFSGTLRDNILFGLPYSPNWYSTVIETCALDEDIQRLPNKDLTLVGERGVSLSGGQKARVNLARAIYRDADIYLLDDPLSAVDAAVSRHIFDKCIKGLLSNHCVILVTHQLQYIQQCDTVLVLNEGRVAAYGGPAKVMTSNFLSHIISVDSKKPSDNSFFPSLTIDDNDEEHDQCDDSDQALSAPEEERAHGSVSLNVYYQFFKTGGGHVFTLFAFFLFFGVEVIVILADWWVLHLIDNSNGTDIFISNINTTLTASQWVAVYGGLTATIMTWSFVRVILFYVLFLRSTHLLHNKMFTALLRAPILFFDTNPVGRILNRFSKDIGYMDDQLQYMFLFGLGLSSYFGGVLVFAVVANPWMLVLLVIIVITFVIVRHFYVSATRELRRLEAISRSPIYSQLSITLQGLPIVRSFSMQSFFMNEFHHSLNRNTQAWYLYIVVTRWLSLHADIMCSLFVAILAFASIPLAASFDGQLLSLALSYTMTISYVILDYILWSSAEVETYMVSTERVLAYSKLTSEAPLKTKFPSKVPPEWPNEGHIEMNNVSYHHSPTGPLVLKKINITILASEKIGIIGRTGAGKSSLIASLFRLAEPEGSIKIDGVDCLGLGLHDVRENISIIPQDPVLFSGTVRYNLDPFDQYNDDDLWNMLAQVQLKQVVKSQVGMLQAVVSEGGSNFSVGQRQLFCLARALLKKNHILVLDEATANVDYKTDAIIQKVIREEFHKQTVLTIAHRLDTVMDSDKIMVLKAGEVCEYGVPYYLLDNPNSHLLKLINKTGPVAASKLKSMIVSAHNSKLLTANSQ